MRRAATGLAVLAWLATGTDGWTRSPSPSPSPSPDAAAASVRGWIARRTAVLGRAGVKYSGEVAGYYVDDVDCATSDREADSAVVLEQVGTGRSCRLSMRELKLTTGRSPRVVGELLLGEGCCSGKACAAASPGAWMVRLLADCRGGDTDGLAELIDITPGTLILETVHDGKGGPTRGRTRLGRGEAAELCELTVAKFACDGAFDGGGRANCTTRAEGERYVFTWRRRGAAVHLARVRGDIGN